MTTKEKSKDTAKGLKGTEAHAKTRVLLALWDLGGTDEEVKKGELTERVKRTNEKAGDYQGVFEQLQTSGAIAISKNKISLSGKGVEMLGEGLKNADFQFDSQLGAKTGNALLKWLREMGTPVNGATATSSKATEKAIASYDEFKQVASDVYDQMNRDYNLNDLVPIYRIRREIGNRVTRAQFTEWMMEMQANDILQLQGGGVEDSAPDKIEDSIRNELGNLRCYAKRLIS
ncbi:hypothetical protein NDA03_16045 [Trichocoleus sp. Lan]|uniref:hypothetical protein n=1 Tax=Trichocoleus sp. Lan TaxID=2933927 RepID=UPI00329A3245